MIRHLTWLTRPVGADQTVLSPAVYAERVDGRWCTRAAADQGFEGVACVDDAARAAIVFLSVMNPRTAATHGAVARGLLSFVASMQAPDGRFLNFIRDWDGRRNDDGPTSILGGPWSARAAHALAVGSLILGDAELADRARDGLCALDPNDENFDVHAVSALAALALWQFTGASDDRLRCHELCETILGGRHDGALLDSAGNLEVHLWGHLQEAALAQVGSALDVPLYVDAARQSADILLVPALARLATADTQSFEASCVTVGLAAVGRATGRSQYTQAANCAAAWFLGRNSARAPVYDPRVGCVYDGIDEQRVSANAGAEASIEGANALFAITRPDRASVTGIARRLIHR